MSQEFNSAIDALELKLVEAQEQVSNIKKAINQLLVLSGNSSRYDDVDISFGQGKRSIRPDQYFGRSLATVVKEYLKMIGHAVSAREIFEDLKKGGYSFEGKDETDQYRGLTISLAKNTLAFIKVGANGDTYGLREFYPDLKDKKREKTKETQGDIDSNSESEDKEN